METKTIYLAGSIAAGRGFVGLLELISKNLEDMGHQVLTKENVIKMSPKYTKTSSLKRRRAIMKRDKAWIRKCDLFIAEVSTYSHGVGYEHRYAEELKKPILLLRHKSLKRKRYSVFLDGTDHAKFMFAFYDKRNIYKILNNFFLKLDEEK